METNSLFSKLHADPFEGLDFRVSGGIVLYNIFSGLACSRWFSFQMVTQSVYLSNLNPI